jgi:hypothetical protein
LADDVDLDLDLSGRRRDDPTPGYALRLRGVTRLCAALLAVAGLCAVLSWFLTRPGIWRPIPHLPPLVPLLASLLATVLILLLSRVRSSILRPAFPRSPALAARPEVVLAAYAKAVAASFALLEGAALLGLAVALLSGVASYGIVLCLAAAFGMLTLWPRAAEVDRLLRGRAKP